MKPKGKLYEYRGQYKTLREWGEVTGLAHDTIRNRLRKGDTIEQALRPVCRKPSAIIKSSIDQGTLCWDCQNYGGGCSWSKRFQPVAGWVAEQHYKPSLAGDGISYKVLSCPEFKPDMPRNSRK